METAVVRVGDDGRGLLIDTVTGSLFKLNRTCVLICRAIGDVSRSMGEIMALLSTVMFLPASAEDDICGFLQALEDKGLLETADRSFFSSSSH